MLFGWFSHLKEYLQSRQSALEEILASPQLHLLLTCQQSIGQLSNAAVSISFFCRILEAVVSSFTMLPSTMDNTSADSCPVLLPCRLASSTLPNLLHYSGRHFQTFKPAATVRQATMSVPHLLWRRSGLTIGFDKWRDSVWPACIEIAL